MEALCLDSTITDDYSLFHGDTCEVVPSLPDESVGFTVFSPPFADLYVYGDSDRDMGNCATDEEFWDHFGYLIPHLLRVTKPGRLCSVHCMDMPATKQRHGYIGLRDFSGDIIRHFQEAGWIFHSRVCIWKDPVLAMQRTKALGLLHKQVVKDSCMSRQGIPDYILNFCKGEPDASLHGNEVEAVNRIVACLLRMVASESLVTFRKPGVNPEPVAGEFDYFCGDHATFKSTKNLSIDIWQRYASPVWMDIRQTNTLNAAAGRDEADERHVCPLQLDVIERCLQLWSNEGDVVLSPFAGIGSEGYVSLKLGRKFVGVELKDSYYREAVKNLEMALDSRRQKSLF